MGTVVGVFLLCITLYTANFAHHPVSNFSQYGKSQTSSLCRLIDRYIAHCRTIGTESGREDLPFAEEKLTEILADFYADLTDYKNHPDYSDIYVAAGSLKTVTALLAVAV